MFPIFGKAWSLPMHDGRTEWNSRYLFLGTLLLVFTLLNSSVASRTAPCQGHTRNISANSSFASNNSTWHSAYCIGNTATLSLCRFVCSSPALLFVIHFPFSRIARAFALLHVPNMPEIKKSKTITNFVPRYVCIIRRGSQMGLLARGWSCSLDKKGSTMD